jgi:hypothetical protein
MMGGASNGLFRQKSSNAKFKIAKMGVVETSLKRQRELKTQQEVNRKESIANLVQLESSHALAGRKLRKLEDHDLTDLVDVIRNRLDPSHTNRNFNRRRNTESVMGSDATHYISGLKSGDISG